MPARTRQERVSDCISILTSIIFDNVDPTQETAQLLFTFRPECKNFIAEAVDMDFMAEHPALKDRYDLVAHILEQGLLPEPIIEKPAGSIIKPHTTTRLEVFVRNDGWRTQAFCRDMDPNIFFPSTGVGVEKAQLYCGSCAVREECLDYALTTGETRGVWGGESERSRKRMMKRIAKQTQQISNSV